MQRPAVVAATLLALALPFAPPAAAGDPDPRADLAELIALASAGVRDEYDGPSPTTLARRILERKEKEARAILEDAWKRAGTKGSIAASQEPAIQHVARYLWSLEKPAPAAPDAIAFGGVHGAIHEIGGIVLVRPGGTGARGKVLGEKGWDRDDDPRPGFSEIVKGGKWRKPPRFDPRAAFKALDGDAAAKWEESEAVSFHLGLGESCGVDAGSRPLLLKRFEDAPGDARLAAAMGRTGAAEAIARLRARIAPLAARVADGKEAALPLLTAACKGVARADGAAFFEETAKLDAKAERAALRAVGFRISCTALLDRHRSAADAAGKRKAILDMVAIVLAAQFSREFPAAGDMAGLVRAWTEALDSGDAELAEWTARGAYGLFHLGFRDGGANLNFSSNEVSVRGSGERCGPYPDERTLLRRLDEDIRAGRIAFSEREPSLFEEPPAREEPKGGEDRAWSGIRCPIPSWMEATEASPLRLSAEKQETGLRLTLTNAGKTPVAIDPLVLRYPTAEHLQVEVKGGPGGPDSFSYLQVEFGNLGGWERWRVPEKAIVVLAPGAGHSFDLVLRADHADVDHVSIEWFDRFQVDGEPKAPLLRRLGWSWAK